MLAVYASSQHRSIQPKFCRFTFVHIYIRRSQFQWGDRSCKGSVTPFTPDNSTHTLKPLIRESRFQHHRTLWALKAPLTAMFNPPFVMSIVRSSNPRSSSTLISHNNPSFLRHYSPFPYRTIYCAFSYPPRIHPTTLPPHSRIN